MVLLPQLYTMAYETLTQAHTHTHTQQTDPLQKAMTAFASALGVSITKLKFTFDGDPIQPTQTAANLDMENDDCIDVRIIA